MNIEENKVDASPVEAVETPAGGDVTQTAAEEASQEPNVEPAEAPAASNEAEKEEVAAEPEAPAAA